MKTGQVTAFQVAIPWGWDIITIRSQGQEV